MKFLFRRALCLLAFCSTLAEAQQYQGPISAPCVVQPNLSCTPVTATNPLPTSGGATGTPTGSAGNPNAAVVTVQGIAGGTPQPISGMIGTNALVVTGDQSYAIGSQQQLNMAPSGGLKVGVSYNSNITPAAPVISQLNSALVAGKYFATRPTWSDGYTGALQVDSTGNLFINNATLSPGAATDTTVNSLFKAGQLIGNTGFNVNNFPATQPVSGTVATTVASGANVTEGTSADTAYAGTGNATIVAALKGIYGATAGPTPAGTAIIGKVGIDQTTPGTTNGVVINSSALPSGSATSANQTTQITAEQAIQANQTNGTQQVLNNVSFLDSTASIAAGGSFNGTARTAPAWATRAGGSATSSQPGMLLLLVSFDGGNSYATVDQKIMAPRQATGNYAATVSAPVRGGTTALYLTQLQNAGTAASALTSVTSNFTNTAAELQGDNAGVYVVSKGSSTIATGQVSVGTGPTLIRAADPGRTSITVIVGAANACAFGNSGVTTTTGYLLPATAGAADTTATSAALYGVCSAATTVSYKVILP